MKTRCFISETLDPFLNLAIEDWIFNDLKADEQILFLWRNGPSVIIGRNQNPWAECDVEKLEAEGVHLVRRHSGGGAVFQDLGNMNFTFLSGKKDYDRRRNFEIIIRALKKFGVEAEVSGRNDILVDGKKISGSAFKEKHDRAFHHGTLLVNVDMTRLGEFLTPSKKKLEAKGTTSVRARVVNLTEVNSEVNVEKLKDAIIEEFFAFYGGEKKVVDLLPLPPAQHDGSPSLANSKSQDNKPIGNSKSNSNMKVEVLNHNSLAEIPEISKYYEMLRSKEWRFGETPQFNQFFEERFVWGGVDVHLYFNEGKIERAKIYSDALETEMILEIERRLKGVGYSKEEVLRELGRSADERVSEREKILEFAEWITKEI